MSKHLTVSPNEAADRLAIRELVEAYAHCADRRDANGQMSLFTADTHFVVHMNARDSLVTGLMEGLFSCRGDSFATHSGSEVRPTACCNPLDAAVSRLADVSGQ